MASEQSLTEHYHALHFEAPDPPAPAGIDPEVWAALPADIRSEIVAELGNARRPDGHDPPYCALARSALAGLQHAGRELVSAANKLKKELPSMVKAGGDAVTLGAAEVSEGAVSSGTEARRVAEEELIPAVEDAVRTVHTEVRAAVNAAHTEAVRVANERIIPAALSTGAAAHRIAHEQVIPAVVGTAGKIADEAQRSMQQLGSFVADTGLLGEGGADVNPAPAARRGSGSRKAWRGPELD